MKQQWVNKKMKERAEKIKSLKEDIRSKLRSLGVYSEGEIEQFIEQAEKAINLGMCSPVYLMPIDDPGLRERFVNDVDLCTNTRQFLTTLPYEDLAITMRKDYSRFLDSEPRHYHGDIIITDPCYVPQFHLPSAMMRDTIYGDWSCTTVDDDTKEKLGEFCADSGMVAVFDLAEVLHYNPGFNYHEMRPWTTTLIKDFDGDCQFIVKHHRGDDYSVHVVGQGVNFKTGKPIRFTTYQTGL